MFRIVNPEPARESSREVGEICVRGASLAAG